jgi:ABC-type phosphate/phosphonate transport system substrate-binding protein
MSGYIALKRMLKEQGADLDIFVDRIATGGHRKSIRIVAEGLADVAAIDCKSWHLALQHEPAANELAVIGWTPLRKGLPFITARR